MGTKACTGVQSEEPHFDFSRNEWTETSAFVAFLNLGLASRVLAVTKATLIFLIKMYEEERCSDEKRDMLY